MSVIVPDFFGLVLRKNENTNAFIEKEIAFLKKFAKGKDIELNEDEHLIAFSVAMNGADLQSAIEALSSEGAKQGNDFVATSAAEGVLGNVPSWLRKEVRETTNAPTPNPPAMLLTFVERDSP